MKVCIKFCGGCNPRIDRVAVAAEIVRFFHSRNIDVVYNNLDADFIVFVSGCSSGCAMRYAENGKACLSIAGSCIDAQSVNAECLGSIAIKKVGDYFEKLERPLQK